MTYNCIQKKGESFSWLFSGIDKDSKYPDYSSEFYIFGTNSKWRLGVFVSWKSQSQKSSYMVKLEKIQSCNPYDNVINVVTVVDRFETPTCSEIQMSSPYAYEYELVCGTKNSLISHLNITCSFYQPTHFNTKEISTQVSDESFEICNKRKLSIYDPSDIPSAPPTKHSLHLENLSEDISGMLQKSIMTDIELKCGEVNIPAHRAVLMSRSEVFSSMFEHEMVKKITNSIDIEDIKPTVFYEFLKYLYSGKISEDLTAEIILELYKASTRYAVHPLQEGCRNMLVGKMTEENCFEILKLGGKYSDQLLDDAISNFIIERHVMLQSHAWKEFSSNSPQLAVAIYQKYFERFVEGV